MPALSAPPTADDVPALLAGILDGIERLAEPAVLLRADAAARYLGMSRTKFDLAVVAGTIPEGVITPAGVRWYKPLLDKWALKLRQRKRPSQTEVN